MQPEIFPFAFNKMKLLCSYLLFIISNSFPAQSFNGDLMQTEFNCPASKMHFMQYMFDTRTHLMDFLDIHKGETVAEVGAGNGRNLGFLSIQYDSIRFYAEEVNPKSLSERKFKRMIRLYSSYRTTKQSNSFFRVIGNMHASLLPDTAFDKILIIDSYHDFDTGMKCWMMFPKN